MLALMAGRNAKETMDIVYAGQVNPLSRYASDSQWNR